MLKPACGRYSNIRRKIPVVVEFGEVSGQIANGLVILDPPRNRTINVGSPLHAVKRTSASGVIHRPPVRRSIPRQPGVRNTSDSPSFVNVTSTVSPKDTVDGAARTVSCGSATADVVSRQPFKFIKIAAKKKAADDLVIARLFCVKEDACSTARRVGYVGSIVRVQREFDRIATSCDVAACQYRGTVNFPIVVLSNVFVEREASDLVFSEREKSSRFDSIHIRLRRL